LFQTVTVPLQLRPDLLPPDWKGSVSGTRERLVPRMLELLQGDGQLPMPQDPIALLAKEFGEAVGTLAPSQTVTVR
jgi:hypothetical protein